ncbi:MAG TPA: protein phosphatase 2C domain-containing protein [Methanotrichaceae archaeon]|nr:protein phosphatase 2C domain-containing protein [Methanotrichaceae archaeon]
MENQDSFRIEEESGFFAVADGMGGMSGGASASKYAVNVLFELINREIDDDIDDEVDDEVDAEKISQIIKEAVIELSDLLRSVMGRHTGTTIVLAFIRGDNAVIAHMGDSRAYLFRDNELLRLTEDHNLFALLLKTKRFTEDELRKEKAHHILIRYVGMENARPDVKVVPIEQGDRFLLCTDGLSEMVKDEEMAEMMRDAQRPEAVLQRLVSRANEAGGYDNITAMIVECIKS